VELATHVLATMRHINIKKMRKNIFKIFKNIAQILKNVIFVFFLDYLDYPIVRIASKMKLRLV
jgi:hypothetical protein